MPAVLRVFPHATARELDAVLAQAEPPQVRAAGHRLTVQPGRQCSPRRQHVVNTQFEPSFLNLRDTL